MNIGEVLNAVYDEDVGWRPASGGIKPVHVANGLVRAVTGRVYDTTDVNRVIVWWKKGKTPDDERRLDRLLASDLADALKSFERKSHDFDRVRRYLFGILGADQGVYPTADQSDLSLTCPQMASRSPNDRGLGDFASCLLAAPEEGVSLSVVLREALGTAAPRDPVTTAVWPLLDLDGREYRSNERPLKALRRSHNRSVLSELQAGATSLASHEQAQGNRLRTLQRAVHFVCAATQAHAQALAAGGNLDKRPPALIAALGAKRSEVALASERSLEQVYERFERWLGEKLADRIDAGKPLTPDGEVLGDAPSDGRGARALFSRIGVAAKGHGEPDKETLDARLADYAEARREYGKEAPARVLAHALVAAYTREYESGGPRSFLQALGRKSGLLFPHFQGRSKEKRVRPSVPVLDMLVRACVPAGEMVPLDDFLQRLWERFGLVVGGRRSDEWDDGEFLGNAGVPLDASALVENSEEFVSQLVRMGLARRYPDNVTFIGDVNAV